MNAIKKILIITTQAHPCACYLARKLQNSGADIYLINQNQPSVNSGSWTYYKRLLFRRGVLVFIDNFAFFAYNRAVSVPKKIFKLAVKVIKRLFPFTMKLVKHNDRKDQTYGLAAFQPDDNLHKEQWLKWTDVERVNSSIGMGLLRSINADFVLLAGAPIINKETMEVTDCVWLNPHYGIVPEYAGSDAPIWAIFCGDMKKLGYTIHYVSPQVDSGPIVFQELVEWNPNWSLREIGRRIAQKMYDRYVKIAEEILEYGYPNSVEQTSVIVRPPAGLFTQVIARLRKNTCAILH